MIRAEFSRRIKQLARAKGICEICHEPTENGQVDHITPAVFGGRSAQYLCLACHRIKTARDMVDIRKSNRVRRKHGEHLARLAEKGKLR